MASAYENYRKWCEKIGVPPATEEKYERVIEYGRGDQTLCAVCNRERVQVFGEACHFCMARGQAPNHKIRD